MGQPALWEQSGVVGRNGPAAETVAPLHPILAPGTYVKVRNVLYAFARHDFQRATPCGLVVVAGLVPDEANHKGILGIPKRNRCRGTW